MGGLSCNMTRQSPPFRRVPSESNFSCFVSKVIELEEGLGMISETMVVLREQLIAALPDFGRHLGYDGKAIQSHSTGRCNQEVGELSDPDVDWGGHETAGMGKDGCPLNKDQTWVRLWTAPDYRHPIRNSRSHATYAGQPFRAHHLAADDSSAL